MISVVLIEDHPLMRRLIRRLLEAAEGFQVVGEAETGDQALALVQSLRPDVAIMDIFMPEMDGFEATKRLRDFQQLPTRVLICSLYATPSLVDEALRSGAAGYLLKEFAVQELADAVLAVSQGSTYLSAHITS